MKIFVYEFITGGGLLREPLPESLAHEADLMVEALVLDLLSVPGITVMLSRDPRLPLRASMHDSSLHPIAPDQDDDPFEFFAHAVQQVDAVWPIAPETGGVLTELSKIVIEERRILLGSRPSAVQLASSKSRTAVVLESAGISAIPSYTDPAEIPEQAGAWVIKPDDGAGCADAYIVPGWRDVRSWLAARAIEGFIAQPWVEGSALSLSLLCDRGEAWILSCNRQHVSVRDARLYLDGITVNAIPDALGAYGDLATRIASTIPGLWGYAGIDFIATERGPVVVEINPRLTTSYCGLNQALGMNPAAMVLSLLDRTQSDALVPGSIGSRGKPVELGLAGHAH